MMEIEIENRKYEFVIAFTDVELMYELWDITESQHRHLMYIRKNEQTNEVEFYSAEMTISFAVVESFLQFYYSQQGTQLSNH